MKSESFLDGKVMLWPGDCLDILAELPANSIDACVTDPPYHLTGVKGGGNGAVDPNNKGQTSSPYSAKAGFMGKAWDGGNIAFQPETWAAMFRVLKPGAHLVAFGGTRTYHRMACAIEDAGFEIRDTVMWLYGSGFPKSHDVSKGIDRAAGAEREVVGLKSDPRYLSPRRNSPNHMDRERGIDGGHGGGHDAAILTAPATDAASQWSGWGTALKPAWEPICLARKPLIGTVAENVLKFGTGALNIDGCRVELGDESSPAASRRETARRTGNAPVSDRPARESEAAGKIHNRASPESYMAERVGEKLDRWPANLIHDGSEEVVGAFPETHGAGAASNGTAGANPDNWSGDVFKHGGRGMRHGDEGSAARFFYTAKADSDDRLGSKHPTVKPLDLMQYLVRLVTPKGGTCIDPFAGTGTTGEAAFREGMKAILIEREEEYQNDIRRRMALVMAGPDERSRESMKARLGDKPVDLGPLFGGGDTPPRAQADRFTECSPTKAGAHGNNL